MKRAGAIIVALGLSSCCVRVPVACCALGAGWWEYRQGEAERQRAAAEYSRQLSDAVAAYERSARELEPKVRAERERHCRVHCDDSVGVLGETRRTKGWCP